MSENAVPESLQITSTAMRVGSNRNEIKVSAEGVAKLTFNFLDELQGDSSLEPGEVKTPPQATSPVTVVREASPMIKMRVPSMPTPAEDAARKDTLLKALKSVSQLEADACEEKVRAILELDAIKRREEAEKRREQLEKRRRSGEAEEDEETKKKAKEERKRLKRLKKEQKAARLALLSDQEDGEVENDEKSKTKKNKHLNDSDSEAERNDVSRSGVNSVAISAAARYPCNMPHTVSHLPSVYPPEAFMGYRPMNPFMRGPRPDFHMARGGFIPRGRGGMRGNPRFSGGGGFRPPFYGPTRHLGPALPRQHTPPPARGHSPIQPPNANLIWTNTKPSISYAFNVRQDNKMKPEQIVQEITPPATIEKPKPTKVKEKCMQKSSSSSSSKQRKKAKKLQEREKVKKRRSSRHSSEKSSKRKIKQIRKSMEKPTRKNVTAQTPELVPTSADEEAVKLTTSTQQNEMWDTIENIKIEKIDRDIVKEITPPFELIKDTIKLEAKETNLLIFKIDTKTATVDNNVFDKVDNKAAQLTKPIEAEVTVADSATEQPTNDANATTDKVFDMFADSPPPSTRLTSKDIDNMLHAARKASENPNAEMKIVKESVESKQIQVSKKKQSAEVAPKVVESDSDPATPPQSLLRKQSVTPPLPIITDTPAEKTPLQKAIEIQKRIDKMLLEDDLKLETIQATKEKLMQKTREHAKESVAAKASKDNKRRTPTPPPEVVPKHRNPFKRSISRERYFGKTVRRSRSRTRENDRKSGRNLSSLDRNSTGGGDRSRFEQMRSKSRHSGGSSASLNRSRSGERDYRGSTGSLNSTRSNERDKSDRISSDSRRAQLKRKLSRSPRRQRTLSNDKPKSLERKTNRAMTPPITKIPQLHVVADKRDKDKNKESSVAVVKKLPKKKKSTPLSFTVAEFRFPEDGEDDSLNTLLLPTISLKEEHTKSTKIATKSEKDDSPDTDDYMDNWENDDADVDINSSTACDSSTPIRSSQEEFDDKFVTRFVNPSPPTEVLMCSPQQPKDEEVISTTPTSSPPLPVKQQLHIKNIDCAVKSKQSRNVLNKELFGMQEIYDQFIKSVEDSGVNMKTAPPHSQLADKPTEVALEQSEELLSTSSTSTSSSSSSSSSDASNSSTSSSSSSSASSSEDSNDAASFEQVTRDSPKLTAPPATQLKDIADIAVEIKVEKITSPTKERVKTMTSPTLTPPPLTATTNVTVLTLPLPAAPPSASVQPEVLPINLPPPVTVVPPPPAPAPVKAQKSDVAKDFKKLKSLEANLSRIQMMRANYDSADEISEELLKMEKLFLQEKNIILLKYAKSTAPASVVNKSTENTQIAPPEAAEVQATPPYVQGQFVHSLQQTAEPENAANKIFDANREAIKLTISPLKLPKTPAIFETANADEHEIGTRKRAGDRDETDFTEKLIKPPKEIAIVKPMMESKESRSSHHQRHRRSPLGSSQHSRSSRTRLSPQRRGRLSASPPRRGANRHVSPPRRGGHSAQTRFRNSARRSSRSRSRSISRQSSNRRSGDLSPPHRRRRATAVGHSNQPHYRKSTRSRDSRSRSPRGVISPRSPPSHGLARPHSPRSPPPQMRRRSYSRERYSRSPLPFKPPSPPMRRSLSPHGARRPRSLSPSRSSSSHRRSRSNSRTRSPMRLPRSPRSPPPPSRYDDHRRRRANSYERRSLSPQHDYYSQQDPNGNASTSSYYYNVSPNRISLDARINIVLNGPASSNQEGGNVASYDSYSNYSQYGSAAYMSVPSDSANYYANQYVQMSHSGGSSTQSPHPHPQQQIYSNIPTISGSGATHASTPHSVASSNFYYNEFGGHPPVHHHPHHHQHHQSVSVLKELPKATVAVQKGNVLEIVPTNEISTNVANLVSTTTSATKSGDVQKKSTKSATISWKEEVNSRHVTAAVLRLSRENEGLTRSILKSIVTTAQELPKDDKLPKKKVYFEDGIFPNRNSEDEDRDVIDTKVRRKVRRLRKRHGVTVVAGNLVADKKRKTESKIDPALEKLPPPPPPPGMPPPTVEDPIYLRPATPTPLFFFHFDAVVHSMYVSQLERPIPPRLLNPKCLPSQTGAAGSAAPLPPHNAATQSPNTHSPGAVGNNNNSSSKKELSTLAAINRSSASSSTVSRNERSSPKMSSSSQRRDIKTSSHHSSPSLDVMHHNEPPPSLPNNSPLSRGTFQAIGSTPLSPQINTQPPPQRQASPIGFVGMRINNFMRLPPSPLAARGPPPVLGLRQHNYNIPPPNMCTPPPNEFIAQQQQHYPPSYATPPPQHHLHQQHHMPHPHHHHHMQHRPPPPNYFMQTAMPVPPPPHNAAANHMLDALTETGTSNTIKPGKEAIALQSSPQAMVAPFNVTRP